MSNRFSKIFPDTLDNAMVLFFTPKGNYGELLNDDGTVAAHYSYLAICKYDGDNSFYLFMCNENFEVETDEVFDTIDECMRAKSGSNDGGKISWVNKSDEIYSHYRLSVEVTFFSGQRTNLPSAGYRPDAVFEGHDDSDQWGIFFRDLNADAFDKPVPATVKFSLQTCHFHQVRVGQRFEMREGPKVVGKGRIVGFTIDLRPTRHLGYSFYEMLLSDDLPEPVYTCPACRKKGFGFDHEHPDPKVSGNTMECCRVCGMLSMMYRNRKEIKLWKESWKENGAKTVFDMPISERVDYVDMLYDCVYRKEYVIPTEDDVKNKHVDKRIFSNRKVKLPFVKDESKLTITNDKGEKWEFPYETNKILELDNDKRYVMLIEECGYARLLASDYLSVRESPRLWYPGLTHEFFGFIGVFYPDCVFEDIEGTVYTATVRLGKGEHCFKDDEFHKKVVTLCGKIEEAMTTFPETSRGRFIHQFMISELKGLDRSGDPSRNKAEIFAEALDKEKSLPTEKRLLSDELLEELTEILEEYKALKRV